MSVVKLKELYPATQVSSRNSEAWKLAFETAQSIEGNEEIIIDTEGMLIEDPCGNIDFKKLMTDKRVVLLLHNSSMIAELIKVFCISCGYDENRIRNEGVITEIVTEKPKFDAELVEMFKSSHTVEENNIIIDVSKSVSQVGSEMTAKSIIEAMRQLSVELGISDLILDFNSIHIQDNVLAPLHKLLKELSNDCSIKVANLPDARRFNTIKSADEGFNSEMPLVEKIKMFKESMALGTVGFLCKFKNSRKKDALGRCGDGIPLWSRYAIYRGCKKKGETVKDGLILAFDVYKPNDFYTKVHQVMEFENSEPELKCMRVTMDFEELGIFDRYTGTGYHFNLPIQYKRKDSINMRVEEKFQGKSCTIFGPVRLPEVAKYVLDDFGVKYNKEKLEEAIAKTNNILLTQTE